MSDERRVRTLGLIGAAVQVGLAVMLALVAGRPDAFPNPPQLIPRGVALAMLFLMPAIIGGIGAVSGRRSLLAAAAVLSTVGSILSFSGVTLLFLAPALIFGAAAGAGAVGNGTRQRPGWQALGLLTLATVGVIAASLVLGIFIIPVIVLLVVALQLSRGAIRRDEGASPTGVAAALGIVALVIGAAVALFGLTGTQCWRAERTPTGIEYRDVPGDASGTISLGPNEVAGGCDSGVPTAGGLAVASILSLAAIGVAVVTASRAAGADVAPDARTRGEGTA